MVFTKGKLCLTSPTAFYDKMTRFVVRGDKWMEKFQKAFDMLSHINLVSKLGCYNLDSWTAVLDLGWE